MVLALAIFSVGDPTTFATHTSGDPTVPAVSHTADVGELLAFVGPAAPDRVQLADRRSDRSVITVLLALAAIALATLVSSAMRRHRQRDLVELHQAIAVAARAWSRRGPPRLSFV